MNQSRKASLLEAVVNVAVGFGISLGAQLVVFPWFGIHVDARTNVQIGGCFTAASLARAYILRRLFNCLILRKKKGKESYAWFR